MTHFDLLIVGTGSGNSILGPEHDHQSVAMVEKGPFGGTCLNVGCIPSKMFVYTADRAEDARNNEQFGIETSFDGADWPAIRDRVFARIDPIAEGGEEYRRSHDNVTIYNGAGTFTGPKQLTVGHDIITADQVVLAAGARVSLPEFDGLADVEYHTSDTIMRLKELPKRLLIIGGGYIASELGHVFQALGSAVTLIVRGASLLGHEDDDIRLRFTEMARHRFDVYTETQVLAARQNGVEISLDISTSGDHSTVTGDCLLVATGRVPNSDQLGVAATGVEVDHAGYVITDPQLRTSVDGIWALGDITNPAQLKHVANHEARVVRHNLSNPDDLHSVDHRFVPHAVFSHPQVASVGLTEREVAAEAIPYVSHIQHYSSTAYGWAMNDTTSFVKVIAHAETRQLIGAHIIGPQASTLIQQCIQAMTFGQTVDEVARGQYFIHPALSEVVEQALLEL